MGRVAITGSLLLLLHLPLPGAPGATEVLAQGVGTKPPVPHQQALSTNPFALLFEWFNAEFERKVGPTATVGLAGSLVSLDGGSEDFASLNALLRYYPQGAALDGFFFGSGAGVYHVDDNDDSANVFGFGLELGYNWLLGADRNFVISLGVGATRLFGGDLEDVSVTIPTVRIVNLGWAF